MKKEELEKWKKKLTECRKDLKIAKVIGDKKLIKKRKENLYRVMNEICEIAYKEVYEGEIK